MKDLIKHRVASYIAEQIGLQLKANKLRTEKVAIKLDVRLSILKPLIHQWTQEAGSQLILSGFERAGIDRIWLRSFQVIQKYN